MSENALFKALSANNKNTFIGLVTSALKKNVAFKNYVNQVELYIPVGDETTTITTGTAKAMFRMPFAMKVLKVKASLATVSSVNIPTIDINKGTSPVTILSTKLTIDATERTSVDATAPAVISIPDLLDDDEITIDIDVAGTGAKGLKVWLIGIRL